MEFFTLQDVLSNCEEVVEVVEILLDILEGFVEICVGTGAGVGTKFGRVVG